jgi:hypothetical protein
MSAVSLPVPWVVVVLGVVSFRRGRQGYWTTENTSHDMRAALRATACR